MEPLLPKLPGPTPPPSAGKGSIGTFGTRWKRHQQPVLPRRGPPRSSQPTGPAAIQGRHMIGRASCGRAADRLRAFTDQPHRKTKLLVPMLPLPPARMVPNPEQPATGQYGSGRIGSNGSFTTATSKAPKASNTSTGGRLPPGHIGTDVSGGPPRADPAKPQGSGAAPRRRLHPPGSGPVVPILPLRARIGTVFYPPRPSCRSAFGSIGSYCADNFRFLLWN